MGLRQLLARQPEQRSDPFLSFDDWVGMLNQFSFGGVHYSLPPATQEDPGYAFSGLAQGAFKQCSIVFSCIQNRVDLFSEARFMYRRMRSGRPNDLFAVGDPNNPLSRELGLLATPWVGATTGDLLARMLLYHDIAGNAYVVRRGLNLAVLRPDWVTIIAGVPGDSDASLWHPDAKVLGYHYQEGGPGSKYEPMMFLPEEVAHFASKPDPEMRFRGMSPLTPVLREIMADKAATDHKLRFFENGATPNLVVKLDVQDLEIYKKWIDEFTAGHRGVKNAYKTMFLGAGADATVVGTNLEQLDFKVTQGSGETRIAAALGVPPVVAGFSEGLAAATYSNYAQARRRFADQTIRPLWRNVCGSLQNIIRTPSDAELWYDARDIAALAEDAKDTAEIQVAQASAVKQLVDAGYEPDAVINAITNDDLGALTSQHTGLFSVQLQPPSDGTNQQGELPAGNGQLALPPGNGRYALIAGERVRRVLMPSGARATVIEEHDGTRIVFDDGRAAVVRDVDA